MTVRSMLNAAAVVAGGVIVMLAVVLAPGRLSEPFVIGTLLVFAIAVGLLFYAPSMLFRPRAGDDAAKIASIGPSGVLVAMLVPLTALAFALALGGSHRGALAIDVLAIGGFFVTTFLLRAATVVVNDVSNRYSGQSRHLLWRDSLLSAASLTRDPQLRGKIDGAAEKLRYVSSDVGSPYPTNSEIDGLISAITEEIHSGDETAVPDRLARLDMLIAQREVFLKAARRSA